jgi:hypothetical protein
VIYLRDAWTYSKLDWPASVRVWASGPAWVASQAVEEMLLLFPGATVDLAVGASGSGDVDVAVWASASGEFETRRQLRWVEQRRGQVNLALAIYTMAPRYFEVVPVAQAGRWAQTRLVTNFLMRWRRRWGRVWRYVGSRCASSS